MNSLFLILFPLCCSSSFLSIITTKKRLKNNQRETDDQPTNAQKSTKSYKRKSLGEVTWGSYQGKLQGEVIRGGAQGKSRGEVMTRDEEAQDGNPSTKTISSFSGLDVLSTLTRPNYPNVQLFKPTSAQRPSQ